jgi:hypothetical protein
MHFSRYPSLLQYLRKWAYILGNVYLIKATLKDSETLCTNYSTSEVDMGKVSCQNSVIQFCCKYGILWGKFLKNSISREQRDEGTNPLQVFHTSWRSTYGQKMGPKQLEHFGMFPRKLIEQRPSSNLLRSLHLRRGISCEISDFK